MNNQPEFICSGEPLRRTRAMMERLYREERMKRKEKKHGTRSKKGRPVEGN